MNQHSCDLLKIHYLCGDKYNLVFCTYTCTRVVICSKFITFAVTNTTNNHLALSQHGVVICSKFITFAVTNTTCKDFFPVGESCDLLKIHYLCGDKYNINLVFG